jgi:hypothetical protein
VAFVVFVVFVATAFVIVGFVVVVMSAGECCLVQSSSQDQRVAQPHCRLSANLHGQPYEEDSSLAWTGP